MKKLAFFIAHYTLKRNLTLLDTIRYFVQKGYAIDLFLFNPTETRAPVHIDKVTIHNFFKAPTFVSPQSGADREAPIKILMRKLLPRRVYEELSYFLKVKTEKESLVIPRAYLDKSRKIVNNHHWSCFIGVEPEGLLWAWLCKKKYIPLFYFSLEIWLKDDPATRLVPKRFALSRMPRILPECQATVIQDEERAEAFAKEQKALRKGKKIYIPVGALGTIPARKKTGTLKVRIPENRKMLLNLGFIGHDRLSLEIAMVSSDLPHHWIMLFHGFCLDPVYLKKLSEIAASNIQFFLSTQEKSEEELYELIASSHVGLVFYRGETQNQRLTSRASNKLAQFLRFGLPIITCALPVFRSLLEKYPCGVAIARPKEIPYALKEIEKNYEKMKKNALRCFEEIYDLTKHLPSLEKEMLNHASM